MTFPKKADRKGMTRGKFLDFLAKIGVLSLITSIPAFSSEKVGVPEIRKEDPTLNRVRHPRLKCPEQARSPLIRGKTLSQAALTSSLSTKNLENIRDLMTGRFFGKAVEQIVKNGDAPLIDWGLIDGSDSGCLIHADISSPEPGAATIRNCIGYLFITENAINVSINYPGGDAGRPFSEEECGGGCPRTCSGYCAAHCPCDCCSKSVLDFNDFVSNPADEFVVELTRLLKTTDVGVIRKELEGVIFSDEVLNMGLQHFVLAAYGSFESDGR